jgi:predicted metal-binding membrane protein
MSSLPGSTRPAARAAVPIRARRLNIDLVVLLVLGIAALGWWLLALTHSGSGHFLLGQPGTSHDPSFDLPPGGPVHHGTPQVGTGFAVLAPGVWGLLGWGLMVLAMMLPPALPLLRTVRRLVSRRPDPWRLTTLSALIFCWIWVAVGVVLVGGDIGVRALGAEWGWTILPQVVAGSALLVAGLYQFSPLKEHCLRACRSPRSFVLAHWQGRRSPGAEVTALSAAYALSCVGCCWALMLVCFAVGTAALPVMVALAVLMTAERLVRWGQHLARPAGLFLIILGAAALGGLLPPALVTLS